MTKDEKKEKNNREAKIKKCREILMNGKKCERDCPYFGSIECETPESIRKRYFSS